eukprot:9310593-Lingulodinium_polyedra.AAC.1
MERLPTLDDIQEQVAKVQQERETAESIASHAAAAGGSDCQDAQQSAGWAAMAETVGGRRLSSAPM